VRKIIVREVISQAGQSTMVEVPGNGRE